VGAGDTLLAITSLCFGAGIPEDLTLLLGNLAAAETVALTGTGNKINKGNLTKAVEVLLK
jgi:bifunctional ADP-heptose synthase (sugar kinase/adenylyltransferase)